MTTLGEFIERCVRRWIGRRRQIALGQHLGHQCQRLLRGGEAGIQTRLHQDLADRFGRQPKIQRRTDMPAKLAQARPDRERGERAQHAVGYSETRAVPDRTMQRLGEQRAEAVRFMCRGIPEQALPRRLTLPAQVFAGHVLRSPLHRHRRYGRMIVPGPASVNSSSRHACGTRPSRITAPLAPLRTA